MDYLSALNEKQQKAVCETEGYEKADERVVPTIKEEKRLSQQSLQQESVCKTDTPNLADYENLWNCEDVPKSGWKCIGVTDLGEPGAVCEMCGHQIIRYVHHMVHPEYHQLDVGCICAGKMEGNIEKAKRREQELKSKETREERFKSRKWKISKNSNSYIKIKNNLIVLYYNRKYNNWKYSINNEFCKEVFATKDEAMDAAVECLEHILQN